MYIMPDPNGSCDVLAFFALYARYGSEMGGFDSVLSHHSQE